MSRVEVEMQVTEKHYVLRCDACKLNQKDFADRNLNRSFLEVTQPGNITTFRSSWDFCSMKCAAEYLFARAVSSKSDDGTCGEHWMGFVCDQKAGHDPRRHNAHDANGVLLSSWTANGGTRRIK